MVYHITAANIENSYCNVCFICRTSFLPFWIEISLVIPKKLFPFIPFWLVSLLIATATWAMQISYNKVLQDTVGGFHGIVRMLIFIATESIQITCYRSRRVRKFFNSTCSIFIPSWRNDEGLRWWKMRPLQLSLSLLETFVISCRGWYGTVYSNSVLIPFSPIEKASATFQEIYWSPICSARSSECSSFVLRNCCGAPKRAVVKPKISSD